MRFKRMLLAALCICLMCEDLWLNNGRRKHRVFTSFRMATLKSMSWMPMDETKKNLHPAHDREDWSPDGTKIAFVSSRDGGGSQIHVMNADGNYVIKLTDGQRTKGDQSGLQMGVRLRFP